MSAPTQAETGRGHSVLLPRLVLGTLLCVSVFLPSLLQPSLTRLYSHLYHSPFYRFSGFETIETILCYGIIEVLFTYKFGRNPHLRIDARGPRRESTSTSVDENGSTVTSKPKIPKMRRPSKRWREMLVYAAPLLLMDFTMIKKFAGVPVSDIRASGNYHDASSLHYFDDQTPKPTTLHSITSTTDKIHPSFLLPTLHNFTLSSPLQLTRALPPIYPTPRRLALELIASFLIYDTLFFIFHLALHRLPPLTRIHKPHHAHPEIHPQITNRLSIPERLSLVLLANFSLNIIGSHVLTRTLFVPVFVFLLVEIHSGLDLGWGYEKILPRGWGSGARAHAWHHRTGQGGLAPFFAWWDAALGVWDERRAGGGGVGKEL